MNYDVLHNFISPVTGRVLCKEDYILVGNRDNIADPSPALIDTKLDLIKLRHDVNELLNATFILEEANFKLPKAQALNILDDGFMYNTGGIISTTNDLPLPNLEDKHLWIGDSNNKPQAVTTIDIANLPNLEQNKLWIGNADNRPVVQSTLNIDNLPNLSNNRVWQGNAQGRPAEVELNFAPSDATYIIKQPNITLTNAQVLSELGVGMAKIVVGGAFAIAIPDEDYATKATLEQIKAETEEFKNQAANSAEQAATSAEEASASATEAATSATEASASATEATTAAGEATAAAGEASGAAAAASGSAGAAASAFAAGASAGSASSSASDASSSASDAHDSAVSSGASASQSLQYLNQLLNTGITLTGEAYGAGKLSEPIHTKVAFSFFKKAELPLNPHLGMLLFVEE